MSPMSSIKDMVMEQVAALPLDPGVYQFLDRDGKVIYVGKAKSLRPFSIECIY